MILVIGTTDGGQFSQMCQGEERAEEWMRRMAETSRRDISWRTYEVEATDVNGAIREITSRAQ